MARSPSLVALLGLAAVAGFQNRDRLRDMINGMSAPDDTAARGGDDGKMASGAAGGAGLGGLLAELGNGGVARGLRDMLDRFTATGDGPVAQSWVRTGRNDPIDSAALERALGEDTLADLTQATGLGRREILERLAARLPETVDGLTPDGHLPRD